VAGHEDSAELPLAGRHQQVNLRLALAGAAALAKHGVVTPLDREAIVRGIEATRWPGRLDLRCHRGRRLLLDGAHNVEAVVALAAHLRRAKHADLRLVFSCLSDKPLAAMAEILRPFVSAVTVVALDTPRATPLEQLAAAFPGSSRAAGVGAAIEAMPRGSTTLVTGSLRLVGDALRYLGVDDE
jgi:dihydrofolate synthase/folylpolyglutamate synthase